MRNRTHFALWLALFGSLFFQPVFGQPVSPNADSCHFKIGTNLAGPADYGSEWPFVNIMKYSREWITHNNQWVTGGQNLWDTGALDKIPTDADGYPLSLPFDIPGMEAPQVVRTVWANTASLPAGQYAVLWEGLGELDVWGDAINPVFSPNKITFTLTPGVNQIFALEIKQSLLGNHVRNIRVLLPGYELTYATQPFSQTWLDKLEPFGTLRFMDWGYTNGQKAANWNERTQPTNYTFTQKTGVPYEWWAAVCNLKRADAWVCVPHRASADYILQMATFFKNNLTPNLKIYVEYSNEVWNWGFDQAHYGLDSLNQSMPWPERLAPKIESVMQIWTDVFANEPDRIVRVMGCQHGWFDIGNRIFAQIETDQKRHLIDAISPAGYLSIDAAQLDMTSTGADVLANANHFSFTPSGWSFEGWKNHAALAAAKEKRLLFYEGGQHFTPDPFGTVQPYCQALLDAQTDPAIYTLYQKLFDSLEVMSPLPMVFMNFSFISPKNCQYGSWGALEHQFDQNPPFQTTAPKYQALLDRIADCSTLPCPPVPAVQGATEICVDYTYIYGVPPQPNAAYFWAITGGVITGGQNTASVSVKWQPPTAQPFNGTLKLTMTDGPCTGDFTKTVSLSALPAPWAKADIGNPTKKGDACFDTPTGQLTMRGGGSDIYGTTDRFYFIKQPFSGDMTLVARINSVQNTSSYSKAGLMIRETDGQSSRNVFVGAMPDNKIFMQRRATTGSSTIRKTVFYQGLPRWFKLTKQGNTFKGYQSINGTTWTLIQSVTVAMGNAVQVGLAVTSKNNTTLCQAVFDQILLSPGILFTDLEADERADETDDLNAGFDVFPNPTAGEFSLLFESENDGPAEISLLNLTGQLVFFEKLEAAAGENEWPVSLPKLPAGAYFLNLKTGDEMRVKRLIINE